MNGNGSNHQMNGNGSNQQMNGNGSNHQLRRHRRIYINERLPLLDDEMKTCRSTIKQIPVVKGGSKPDASQIRQFAIRIYNIQRVAELKQEKERIINERNDVKRTLRKVKRSTDRLEAEAFGGLA